MDLLLTRNGRTPYTFLDLPLSIRNEFLDACIWKLTPKKWCKLAKVSLDTAARDIKQLTEAGILVPQEGKFRNVPYGIVISKDLILTPCPEDDED